MELMLDSGSSISLVQRDVLSQVQDIVRVKATRSLPLVTASGEQLPIVCHIRTPVKLAELKLLHDFVVVEHLVTPVILGVDFLHENALVLDFTQSRVVVRHTKPGPLPQPQVSLISDQAQVLPLYEAERRTQARACAIVALEQPEADIVDECAVPNYHKTPNTELPECPESCLYSVVDKYRGPFCTTPGVTKVAYHFIPTTGNPVKVPPTLLIIERK